MGIPKFYNDWIKKKRNTGILMRSVPPNVSSLSIDMNGLIHDRAQFIYAYGEYKNDSRLKQIERMDQGQLRGELFSSIREKILEILYQVQPREVLILAVDGVAPNAKIAQQRQRRFRSAYDSKLQEEKDGVKRVFDSNSITPGTEFMNQLDAFLSGWLVDKYINLPPKVVYSSHQVPGEGEHKIFDLMRDGVISPEMTGAHVVYGLDADLVMLSLIAPVQNIFLMREDIMDVINIENLKKYLVETMGTETGVEDFVLISFLLGNDFLPHPPSGEDLGWALDQLVQLYQSNHLNLTLNVEGQVKIDWPNFTKYLRELSKMEESMLLHEYDRLIEYPSKILEEATTKIRYMSSQGTSVDTLRLVPKVNYPKYRFLWYGNALKPRGSPEEVELIDKLLGCTFFELNEEDIEEMGQNFLSGVAWTLRYYHGGMSDINLDWMYLYHFTPLLGDLVKAAEKISLDPSFDNKIKRQDNQLPINPVHQLLAVLPKRSQNLIPPEARILLTDSSPIADLYPEKFYIDLEGKSADWQGIVLIPRIDINRVVEAVSQYVVFTEERINDYAPNNNIVISRISPGTKTGFPQNNYPSSYVPSRRQFPPRNQQRGFPPRSRGSYRARTTQ